MMNYIKDTLKIIHGRLIVHVDIALIELDWWYYIYLIIMTLLFMKTL